MGSSRLVLPLLCASAVIFWVESARAAVDMIQQGLCCDVTCSAVDKTQYPYDWESRSTCFATAQSSDSPSPGYPKELLNCCQSHETDCVGRPGAIQDPFPMGGALGMPLGSPWENQAVTRFYRCKKALKAGDITDLMPGESLNDPRSRWYTAPTGQ